MKVSEQIERLKKILDDCRTLLEAGEDEDVARIEAIVKHVGRLIDKLEASD